MFIPSTHTEKDIYLVLPYRQNKFTVHRDFSWWCEMDGNVEDGIVKEGTSTDFASIPLFLQYFLSPTDPRVAIPSLIHDALYQDTNTDRKYCDRIFLYKMIAFGMPLIKAWLVYTAVRLFGKKFKK